MILLKIRPSAEEINQNYPVQKLFPHLLILPVPIFY